MTIHVPSTPAPALSNRISTSARWAKAYENGSSTGIQSTESPKLSLGREVDIGRITGGARSVPDDAWWLPTTRRDRTLLPATAADVNVAPASAEPLSFGGGRRANLKASDPSEFGEERGQDRRVVARAPGGAEIHGRHVVGQLAVDHAVAGQRAQRARHERDAHARRHQADERLHLRPLLHDRVLAQPVGERRERLAQPGRASAGHEHERRAGEV